MFVAPASIPGAEAFTALVAAKMPKEAEKMMPKRPAVNALNMILNLYSTKLFAVVGVEVCMAVDSDRI